MENSTNEIGLQLKKLELECRKLECELDDLKKPWWKKASGWTVLVPLFVAVVTGVVSILTHDKDELTKEQMQQVTDAGKGVSGLNQVPSQGDVKKIIQQDDVLQKIKDSL